MDNISNTWIGDANFAKIVDDHPKKVGYAFRNAVNETVFEVQKSAQSIFSSNFTERNKFTQRGIQYDRSKIPTLEGTEAIVGGKLNRPWLLDQHTGFKSDNAQATEMVRTSGAYTRAVRKKNYLQGASIRRRMDVQSRATTIRGKSQAVIYMSKRQGFATVNTKEFLQFNENELSSGSKAGLYQFDKTGNLMMSYRLNNKRIIKATPWLDKAVQKEGTPELIYKRFEEHLIRQMNRGK